MLRTVESEVAMCRSIFIVSLRDMLSSCSNPYTKKCKRDAKIWLDTPSDNIFSFNNVVTFLFGEDTNEDLLRTNLKGMLRNRRIKGTRNLNKILTKARDEGD